MKIAVDFLDTTRVRFVMQTAQHRFREHERTAANRISTIAPRDLPQAEKRQNDEDNDY